MAARRDASQRDDGRQTTEDRRPMTVLGLGILEYFKGLLCPVIIVVSSVYIYIVYEREAGSRGVIRFPSLFLRNYAGQDGGQVRQLRRGGWVLPPYAPWGLRRTGRSNAVVDGLSMVCWVSRTQK